MANVLIIEDMSGVRQTLEIMLKGLNHSVTTAVDGDDGLRKASEASFDLVITDIMMPEKDGIDVIMGLKKAGKDLPVIAISGGGTKVSADDALSIAEHHADTILKKPFTKDELSQAIQSVLT